MLLNYRGKREGGRERDTGKLKHYWKETIPLHHKRNWYLWLIYLDAERLDGGRPEVGLYGSAPPTEDACEEERSEPESSVWNLTLRMLLELRVPLRWKLPCRRVPADIFVLCLVVWSQISSVCLVRWNDIKSSVKWSTGYVFSSSS